MVLVPKEVRRLEKDISWSCDGPPCKDAGEGCFPEKSRYRCVHYGDGGRCNRDLCGDCFKPKETSASPQEESGLRRSGREPRPSALRAGEEWEVGESRGQRTEHEQRSPQGKMRRVGATPPSPLKAEISPGRVGRRSNDRRGGRARSEEQQTPLNSGSGPSGRTTRRTPASADSRSGGREEKDTRERGREERVGRETRGERRRGHDEGSPKRSGRGSSGRRREEASSEEEQDTPIYPAPGHVRFSPSVKNKTSGSPFGRKTRSGRRPYSYIQSLPSEDEQSAFNKQYSRDLRKRQKRKASEEDAKEEEKRERRSSRHRLESSSGGEELSLGARKRNLRAARKEQKEEEEEEGNEEEDDEDAGDPTVTEASVRRSSRRRLQSEGEAGEEADTESGVEKEQTGDNDTEEEETPVRRSSRRRILAASEEDEEEGEEEEDADEEDHRNEKRKPPKRKSEVDWLKRSDDE